MADRLPDWITVENTVGDLAALVPRLGVYARFARQWRAIGAAVWKIGAAAPIDSPAGLASYLADKLDDPAIVTIFDTLGLAALRGELAAIAPELADRSRPWAKLLEPAGAFVETYAASPASDNSLDDGDNRGLIALPIPRLAADGRASPGPASVTFGISTKAGLECEAGSVWPFRGDQVTPGLLRIGADGMVDARAGASLPLGQIGTGRANIAASAGARLDFFFRPGDPQTPFGELLLPALAALPNPADLSDIGNAVEFAGLEGLLLICKGDASTGFGVTIGVGQAIPDVVALSAGVVADVRFRRDARWLLSLRKTAAGLRFVLSRDLSREYEWSAGIEIGVDYAPLARHVHDALVKADGLAGPLLAQVRPFLSPGTYLAQQARGQLDAAVSSIIAEPDLRQALTGDLGLLLGNAGATDDLALAGFLRQRITDFVADHAGGILADAEQWARHVAAGLAKGFPALATDDLLDRLVARIKPVLGDIEQQFKSVVDQIVQAKDLARELQAAGVTIAQSEARADALLAGLRQVVSEFDRFSRRVIEKTGESVDHKLRARFRWNGAEEHGVQYDLTGTFTKITPETQALWRALVSGRLEPFQRIMADPGAAPAGIVIDGSSSVARFTGVQRGFAADVVILDLSASINLIVEGTAHIELSAAGDITVAAQATASRSVDGFDEGRSARFVSTWDLALHKVGGTARDRRAMGLAIALDHNDKHLAANEVSGLIEGLAKKHLVEQTRVTRAVAIHQEWRTAALPGKNVQGRIALQMSLTDEAIDRMLALGRSCGAVGGSGQYALFKCAGEALLAAGVSDSDEVAQDCSVARREFREIGNESDIWRIMLSLQNTLLPRVRNPREMVHPYRAFTQLIPRAISFPRMLATMADIYDAIPADALKPGKAWDEGQYANAEKTLAEHAQVWLRLNTKFIFWMKTGLHPVLLAFLRLLADMNRPLLAGHDPFADLDTHVDTATSSAMIAITMTQPGNAAGARVV